ncbi:ATP-dependent nuclease [Campylobacter troglodytis]|uniref:ATP-dependent nuclease n=1 Tax=Campylobacter troglodytis TaxID=654363 RepID=UPI00115AAD86|nr:AAA family ATPase [Campylobacter troglodytis]TQR61617.1 hypothetical protein DMC01_00150 [Campylobacter troglodytis]
MLDEEFEYFANFDLGKKQDKFNAVYKEWQTLRKDILNRHSYLSEDHLADLKAYHNRLAQIFFAKGEADRLIRYELENKFGIKPCPKVIVYDEKELKDDDLYIEPKNLDESGFFNSLFEVLADDGKCREMIKKHYDSQKFFQRRELIKNINQRLKSTVTKCFNELYYGTDKDEIYSFELGLEDNKLEFYLLKNEKSQKLSQQSVGFRWFFNFFFNFLHTQSLEKGDLVLIDELGATLSVPTQRHLREFLKEFAKTSGISFIISTHSPFLADMDFLDELRIIRQKGDGSSEIINYFFSADDNVDALKEIKQAFGVQHLWEAKQFVFVEGITDYNYLTKFKQLFEKEKGERLNFAFLPVNGLGKFEEGKESLTDKQKLLIEELPKIAKANKDKAILLVDNDKAGRALRDYVKNSKDLAVITVDFDKNATNKLEIEDLFSQKDYEVLEGLDLGKNTDRKSFLSSQNYKNNYTPDDKSKENFFKLLKYLNDFVEKNEA